jgi:hypothetical protein
MTMTFETSTDGVCLSSENGDAIVPGVKAVAIAKKEAKSTGKPVTIRNPITDKVLATVKPDGQTSEPRRTKQQAAANLKAAKEATKKEKAMKKASAKTEKAPAKKAAAKKAPAKKVAKKAAAPRGNGEKPVGMTGELVKLALRDKGVTPAQLNDHSKWKGAPWKWFFSNPKKTGVADRFGYKLRVEKEGRAVTYFLTAK